VGARDGKDGKVDRPASMIVHTAAGARKAQRLLSELGDDVPEGKVLSPRNASELVNQKRRAKADSEIDGEHLPDQTKLYNCNFREVGSRIEDESADLIFTDLPYGAEFLPLWDDLGRSLLGRSSRARCW
jgi:hypothetical protein